MIRKARYLGLLLVLLSGGAAFAAQLLPSGRGNSNARSNAQYVRITRQEFVKVLEEFRVAITQYREALDQEQGLDKRAKEIQKHIGDLMDFLKEADVKDGDFHESEFADFSPKELAWETLTTAERTDNDLRLVLRVLDIAARENVITIQAIQFFRLVQTDLQRLKWLTSKVGERPRQESGR
jgi:hypothetical protein